MTDPVGDSGLDLAGAPTRRAPSRLTRLALTSGTVLSAATFGVALLLEVLAAGAASTLTDPLAWATLGTVVVIVTPAAGLLATAWEYRSVADRRSAGLAIVVLGVLGVSLLAALLR